VLKLRTSSEKKKKKGKKKKKQRGYNGVSLPKAYENVGSLMSISYPKGRLFPQESE